MSDILKLATILGLVTVIAAGALSAVNSKTKPVIEAYMRAEEARAREQVLPEAAQGVYVLKDPTSAFPYYVGYAQADSTQPVGYVFRAYGKGYSSTIQMVVGVDLRGVLMGISIISQQETPGLGAKIEEIRYGESAPWFQRQFRGKSASNIALKKYGGEIDAVTGATISSRAVTEGIKAAFAKLSAKVQGLGTANNANLR